MSKSVISIIIIALVLSGCCCLLALCVVGGVGLYEFLPNQTENFEFNVNPTVIAPMPFFQPTEESFEFEDPEEIDPTPQPTREIITKEADSGAAETLKTLEEALVPVNDLRDLSERLKGVKDIPEAVTSAPKEYNVGDKETFWVSEDESHENFKVDAVLRYEGNNVYFWVDQKSKFNQSELDKLAKTFDEKIYATDRSFFGSEWSPGIDNDPHLYILYVKGVGDRIAGYFSSADEVMPEAHKYSNAHEMFIINSDTGLSDDFTYGVLAHEFQHMIHFYRDRNEESWLNEGFSELAVLLNGYDVGGFDYAFMNDPDLQLNDWPNDPNATMPHYGAGFMYVNYFLNRFGEEATQALVANQNNGMDSIDEVLTQLNLTDSATGQPIKADDVFGDWVVTNYLLDPNVGDGRYTYQNYAYAPKANATTSMNCPESLNNETVHQYGADYIDIRCNGKYTLNFQGSTEVELLPQGAHSGKYSFWSNKGDESDMTLTQSFDFSNVTGDLSINYWTWYDLEEDFDYLYIEASEDGTNWKILKTPSGTDQDVSGNSYGWGYNGTTSGWIEEKVSLEEYKGKKVQLRFEYITDAAVNGEGLLLDDVSIPAIDYSTDFESDQGGWESEGFVRVQNVLPQTYRLSLIKNNNGDITVENIPLDKTQNAKIDLNFDDYSRATLVVSGTTRFTRSLAPYSIQIEK